MSNAIRYCWYFHWCLVYVQWLSKHPRNVNIREPNRPTNWESAHDLAPTHNLWTTLSRKGIMRFIIEVTECHIEIFYDVTFLYQDTHSKVRQENGPIKKTTYTIVLIMQTTLNKVLQNKDNEEEETNTKRETFSGTALERPIAKKWRLSGGCKPGLLAQNLTLVWKYSL